MPSTSSSSSFSIFATSGKNSSLKPHPDTARGSWTGQLLSSLQRRGSSMNCRGWAGIRTENECGRCYVNSRVHRGRDSRCLVPVCAESPWFLPPSPSSPSWCWWWAMDPRRGRPSPSRTYLRNTPTLTLHKGPPHHSCNDLCSTLN